MKPEPLLSAWRLGSRSPGRHPTSRWTSLRRRSPARPGRPA